MCFWAFLFSLYNLFLVLYLCGLSSWLVELQTFKIYWGSFCGLVFGLFWKMFHVHLRRMCILLLLGGMFYRCLLGPSVLMCCSVPLCSYLFSLWWICPLECVVCWSLLEWMHCILFPPLIMLVFLSCMLVLLYWVHMYL